MQSPCKALWENDEPFQLIHFSDHSIVCRMRRVPAGGNVMIALHCEMRNDEMNCKPEGCISALCECVELLPVRMHDKHVTRRSVIPNTPSHLEFREPDVRISSTCRNINHGCRSMKALPGAHPQFWFCVCLFSDLQNHLLTGSLKLAMNVSSLPPMQSITLRHHTIWGSGEDQIPITFALETKSSDSNDCKRINKD